MKRFLLIGALLCINLTVSCMSRVASRNYVVDSELLQDINSIAERKGLDLLDNIEFISVDTLIDSFGGKPNDIKKYKDLAKSNYDASQFERIIFSAFDFSNSDIHFSDFIKKEIIGAAKKSPVFFKEVICVAARLCALERKLKVVPGDDGLDFPHDHKGNENIQDSADYVMSIEVQDEPLPKTLMLYDKDSEDILSVLAESIYHELGHFLALPMVNNDMIEDSCYWGENYITKESQPERTEIYKKHILHTNSMSFAVKEKAKQLTGYDSENDTFNDRLFKVQFENARSAFTPPSTNMEFIQMIGMLSYSGEKKLSIFPFCDFALFASGVKSNARVLYNEPCDVNYAYKWILRDLSSSMPSLLLHADEAAVDYFRNIFVNAIASGKVY